MEVEDGEVEDSVEVDVDEVTDDVVEEVCMARGKNEGALAFRLVSSLAGVFIDHFL